MSDMRDVAAPCITMRVVSAKLEDEWIIRGVTCWDHTDEALRAAMRPFFALHPLVDQVEWTSHTYRLPHYHVYGSGDIPATGWPARGVFIFRRVGDGRGIYATYRDAERLLDEQLRPIPNPQTSADQRQGSEVS